MADEKELDAFLAEAITDEEKAAAKEAQVQALQQHLSGLEVQRKGVATKLLSATEDDVKIIRAEGKCVLDATKVTIQKIMDLGGAIPEQHMGLAKFAGKPAKKAAKKA
jgi:hypothetical protein